MGLLQDKLTVVTAGTAGIGRAVAERFVAEGADVVVTARGQREIDETVAALGPHVTGVRADACDLADLAASLGFASHSHLTTAFTRYYGLPPRAARTRSEAP